MYIVYWQKNGKKKMSLLSDENITHIAEFKQMKGARIYKCNITVDEYLALMCEK